LNRLSTLQPDMRAGVNLLSDANCIALLANWGSLAPVMITVLVSAIPLGRTTKSTATLSPGRIEAGTGSVRGVPSRCASGSASSDMYLETLSDTPAHRASSSGVIDSGLGPDAHPATITAATATAGARRKR
jgi:hypothetical protein